MPLVKTENIHPLVDQRTQLPKEWLSCQEWLLYKLLRRYVLGRPCTVY